MKKIVFYDTETTGLPDWKNPSTAESQPHIVQLAAIQCNAESREIIQTIDVIVQPDGWEIPTEYEGKKGEVIKTEDLHGITTEMAKDVGIPEPEVLTLFSNLCGLMTTNQAIRVSHNRTFDQRIIRIGLKRYQFWDDEIEEWADKDMHPCTMLKAKPIMALPPRGKYGWKKPKLEEAYQYFCGKELGKKAHSAMPDTQACMEIYWAIKDREKDDVREEISAKHEKPVTIEPGHPDDMRF